MRFLRLIFDLSRGGCNLEVVFLDFLVFVAGVIEGVVVDGRV